MKWEIIFVIVTLIWMYLKNLWDEKALPAMRSMSNFYPLIQIYLCFSPVR